MMHDPAGPYPRSKGKAGTNPLTGEDLPDAPSPDRWTRFTADRRLAPAIPAPWVHRDRRGSEGLKVREGHRVPRARMAHRVQEGHRVQEAHRDLKAIL